MPDPTPDPTPDDPTPDPVPDPTPVPEPDKDPDDDLGDAGKRALDRERAARAQAEKELKDAQARLKRIEDKTELQREAEARTAAEGRAEAAESKQLRVEIAIKKKLPLDMADRLVGKDQNELEKDADKLLKVVAPTAGNLDQGARGAPANKPKSMNDVVREAFAGKK
jgi:hypothetical protein